MVYLSSFLQIQKLNTSYALVYAAWCIATMPDRQHQINKKKEKKKKKSLVFIYEQDNCSLKHEQIMIGSTSGIPTPCSAVAWLSVSR